MDRFGVAQPPRDAGGMQMLGDELSHPIIDATAGGDRLGMVAKGLRLVRKRRNRVEIVLKKELPPLPTYIDSVTQVGETVIAAGRNHEIHPAIFQRRITSEAIKGIKDGSLFFYMFGHIKYADIFGSLHTYGFCLQFLPKENSVF